MDGTWHVFHQFNPAGPTWGSPRWAHLTSKDLVRWEPQPLALVPLGTGPDGAGVWSGCVVIDGETPSAMYTGAAALPGGGWAQSVCLARSDRNMLDWRRYKGNPVVAGPPHRNSVGFRDPWLFRNGLGWAMILGTGIEGVGGAIALYRGSDLENWTFDGYILQGDSPVTDQAWTGRMWECPQLARSGDTDILVWSVWDDHVKAGPRFPAELLYPVVAAGHFDGRKYRIDRLTRFDHGADCYAPAFLLDGDRILSWGWSWESLTDAGREQQGWAGTLTFPREVWATAEGHVRQRPAAELSALRGAPWTIGKRTLGSDVVRAGLSGDRVELLLRVRPGSARIALEVLADPDGRERTRITYDPETGRLEIDRAAASLWSEAVGGSDGGQLSLDGGEPLEVRVLIDVSIVELFANDRLVITERVYPTLDASTGISLVAEGEAELDEFTVWPLRLPK